MTEYVKTTWKTGDIITAKKLNNIEDGIKTNETNISSKANSSDVYTKTEIDTYLNDTVKSVNNIKPDTNGNVELVIPTRNIGEIVSSTIPLTDAGLHLLDGSRLLGDGIYKGFVDYIAELYVENPNANYFIDETTWQNTVTTYGSCGKFVYDSTLNTVRLPKVSDILQGTTDVNALGDLIEAGLPNITSSMGLNGPWYAGWWSDSGQTGALHCSKEGSTEYAIQSYQTNAAEYDTINFDASRSSSIYGNSSTVQPQAIRVLYYIVIANSTKTEIEVDIDNIATDLNNKADKDLSNLSTTGQNVIDGQYVDCQGATIINYGPTTTGTTGTVDLSSYLPTNNCLCTFTVFLGGTNSSNAGGVLIATLSGGCGVGTQRTLLMPQTTSNLVTQMTVPVINKTLSYRIDFQNITADGSVVIYFQNYRRLGTNA